MIRYCGDCDADTPHAHVDGLWACLAIRARKIQGVRVWRQCGSIRWRPGR